MKSYKYFCSGRSSSSSPRLERRQPEGVAAVLDSEDAEQEGVHAQKNGTPEEDSNLLSAGIGNTRYLESQADSGKGEDTICKSGSALFD